MTEAGRRGHALVTGGGTGIGRAVAERLVEEGWWVTVVGRRLEPLAAMAARSEALAAEVGDVTVEASVHGAFAAARARFGPIDALVAAAGAAESAPAHRTSLESWRRALDVNLTGAFLAAREVLPSMIERGTGGIVFVASTAGIKGYAYVAPYCAAKHGLVGLTRALAVETAKRGITVNAVCPGYTETPMLESTLAHIAAKTGRTEAEARVALLGSNPQGRFVTPEEVAATVSWLLSEGAGSITGQAIAISGGEV